MDDFLGENESNEALSLYTKGLKDARDRLDEGTNWLMKNGLSNFDNAAAASTDYLNLFGLTAIAYMWAKMAKVALEKKAAGETDPYYDTKLKTATYYVERLLPETAAHLAKMQAGSESMMALEADAF